MFETQLTAAYTARSGLLGVATRLVSQIVQFESDSAAEFAQRVADRQAAHPAEALLVSQAVVQAEMEAQVDAITVQLDAVRVAAEAVE